MTHIRHLLSLGGTVKICYEGIRQVWARVPMGFLQRWGKQGASRMWVWKAKVGGWFHGL